MLGRLSIGILLRDIREAKFVCGNCGFESSLMPTHLPAALSIEESATILICERCHSKSSASRIELVKTSTE